MQRAALAGITLLAVAACTSAPPHPPLAPATGVAGGFSEQRLDDSHFRVIFKGADTTSRTRVEAYLLYRAAELTAVQGGDWFEMVDRRTGDTGRNQVDPASGRGYWRPDWTFHYVPEVIPWGGPTMGPFEVMRQDSYSASAVIALGRGPTPAGDARAFDARRVMQTLGPRVRLPG